MHLEFVAKNPNVSPGAKALYLLLVSYADSSNTCFPGMSRLASELGLSRQTIHTYMKELISEKAIAKYTVKGRRSNVYNILGDSSKPAESQHDIDTETHNTDLPDISASVKPALHHSPHVKPALHEGVKQALHESVKPALHEMPQVNCPSLSVVEDSEPPSRSSFDHSLHHHADCQTETLLEYYYGLYKKTTGAIPVPLPLNEKVMKDIVTTVRKVFSKPEDAHSAITRALDNFFATADSRIRAKGFPLNLFFADFNGYLHGEIANSKPPDSCNNSIEKRSEIASLSDYFHDSRLNSIWQFLSSKVGKTCYEPGYVEKEKIALIIYEVDSSLAQKDETEKLQFILNTIETVLEKSLPNNETSISSVLAETQRRVEKANL